MYLLEETPEAQEMRENVKDLLSNDSAESATLAYQLIKAGGVHHSLLPYLRQSTTAFQRLEYRYGMRDFLREKEFPTPNFYYDFTVRSCRKISHSVYEFDFVPYSRWDIRRAPIYFKATNKRVSDAYNSQTGYKMKGTLEDIAQCVLNKLKERDSDIGAFMVYFSHGNETGNFDGVPFALRGKLCSMAESQGLCMY